MYTCIHSFIYIYNIHVELRMQMRLGQVNLIESRLVVTLTGDNPVGHVTLVVPTIGEVDLNQA